MNFPIMLRSSHERIVREMREDFVKELAFRVRSTEQLERIVWEAFASRLSREVRPGPGDPLDARVACTVFVSQELIHALYETTGAPHRLAEPLGDALVSDLLRMYRRFPL